MSWWILAATTAGAGLGFESWDWQELPVEPDGAVLPVVGGSPVEAGQWRDAAAVANSGVVNCTGVLIAPDVVLTAGHCIQNVSHVILDTTDHDARGETLPALATERYPNHLTTYDVGLVLLAEAALTPPRPLALDCIAEDHVRDGADVAIVGFGSIDPGGGSFGSVLYEGLTTVRDHDCDLPEAGCMQAVSPGGELIAGGDGIDSCNGDSGGPLYLLTPQGDYLVGITSRAALPASVLCGDGGIYVRVDAIDDWIEEVSGLLLERPDCATLNRAPQADDQALVTPAGVTASLRIPVRDPDADDLHVFELIASPAHGFAVVGPTGWVSYLAPIGFVGDDSAVVRITDNGAPPLTIEVEVALHVVAPEPGGCGCAGSPAPAGSLALWAIGLLVVRRRR